MVAASETISESKAKGSRRGRWFGSWFAALRNSCCFLPPSGGWSPAGAQRLVRNLYQGTTLDAESGLYYANARYYSPHLGRFISEDPSGFAAGDSNLYRYVDNHPTYSTDPTGLYEGGSAGSSAINAAINEFQTGIGPTSAGSGGYANAGSGLANTGGTGSGGSGATSSLANSITQRMGGYSNSPPASMQINTASAVDLGTGPASSLAAAQWYAAGQSSITGVVAAAVGGVGQEVNPVTNYQNAVNSTAFTMATDMEQGASWQSALYLGVGQNMLSMMGVWQGYEAATGQQLVTGNSLNAMQRVDLGFQSVAGVTGTAGIVGMAYSSVIPETLAGQLVMPSDVAALTARATYSAIGSTRAVGESSLSALGGESQVYFPTSMGGRYVDQLVGGVANESKVGYQSLTPSVQLQIAKDAELIQTGAVKGATWHFFQSPVTGLGGPSQPLLNALQQAGIKVVIH